MFKDTAVRQFQALDTVKYIIFYLVEFPLCVEAASFHQTMWKKYNDYYTNKFTYTEMHTYRPVVRGSVGSEELPSQIKGPLFANKRSTFYE